MSPDPDLLEQALAGLAARADGHDPADRLARVRTKARRAAVARTAVPVAALTLVAVTGLSALALKPFDRAVAPATTTSTSPTTAAPTTEPTPDPSPSTTTTTGAATTTTTEADVQVDWADHTYPNSCGLVDGGTVEDRFTKGTAERGDFDLEADPGHYLLGGRVPVVAVVVHCYGPTGHWPDTVLVYRDDGSAELIGTAIDRDDDTLVDNLTVEDGKLVVRARGWSEFAPRPEPDLQVKTTVRVEGGQLRTVVNTTLLDGADPKRLLNITLRRKSSDGARAVLLNVKVEGLVPQVSSDGKPLPARLTTLGSELIDWGDGGDHDGSDGGSVQCIPGAPLVPLPPRDDDLNHTYARPGTYTITYTAGVCDPVGEVERTIEVTVQ